MANVGALFRTCDGAGVSELLLSGYTGTPPDRRIAKVALGAEEFVPWRHVPDFADLAGLLAGMYTVVLEQHADAAPLDRLDLPATRDIALVACEELFGADEDIIAESDALLELPMRGSKHSLNVSIAAGIAMYHLADRMWGTPPASLASRQPVPVPVREGVLTLGVTTGEDRTRHLEH